MNYYIQKGDQRLGPLPEDEAKEMLATGAVNPGDLCWRDGLTTWIPLAQEMGVVGTEGPLMLAPGRYAGFWLRVAAALIDSLVLLVPGVCLGIAAGMATGFNGNNRTGYNVIAQLSSVGIGWLYSACMENSSLQATLGKMALGLRVTDVEGRRIGFGRATGRHFAKFLSGLILMIGYMMAGFTDRKQALHDMIASCLVVRQ